MEFNAKQLREDALVKKGRYKFRVLQGREKTTNGNPMIVLKMVLAVGAREVSFWDTLLFIPKMFWKAEHYMKATGQPEKIDEGNLLAQDCDGNEGYCEIDHRVNKETGEVEAFVKDYVKPEDLAPSESEELDFINDDVPSFE